MLSSARFAWQTTPRIFGAFGAAADALLSLVRWWPVFLPAAIVFVWASVTWAPEGDSALHLRLMIDIAELGRLPHDLPIAADLAPGGVIAHRFPYSYTPLHHLVGAAVYGVAGERALPLISAAAAGLIAYVVFTAVHRRYPFAVAATCAVAWMVPSTTMLVFTRLYSEPMMVAAFLLAGLMAYHALMLRRPSLGFASGACLAIAVSSKQIALLYAFTLALVIGSYLLERGRWRQWERDWRWMVALTGAFAIVAAPSVLYLSAATGTIGYADIHLPGFGGRVPVDPGANAYFASITKPEGSVFDWLDRYRQTLMFSERWLPAWLAAMPVLLFIVGASSMVQRGGSAGFVARLAIAQVGVDALMYATVHGNDRYVMASRTLVCAIAPVGIYVVASYLASIAPGRAERRALARALFALMVFGAIGVAVLHPDYLRLMNRSADSASVRRANYEEMGAWVRVNTEPDATILVPRTYTASLTFKRDVTWISPYGNAWIVEVIGTPDPARAHELLRRYGIDYVAVGLPSGSYVDRVPVDGMRSYLGPGHPESGKFFTLSHRVGDSRAGLWLYRVEPGVMTVAAAHCAGGATC